MSVNEMEIMNLMDDGKPRDIQQIAEAIYRPQFFVSGDVLMLAMEGQLKIHSTDKHGWNTYVKT